MSTRIREALSHLEDDTAGLRLAPPTQVRARGDALRRRRVAGVSAAAVTVTVAGVLVVAGSASGPTAHAPAKVVPAASRPAIIECGAFVLGMERLPSTAIACFLDAVAAGHPARLTETRNTTEGDPIVFAYLADATGTVAVTVDTRQDKFGYQGFLRQTCTGPIADHGHIGFTQCSSSVPA